jgi:hypothetical protein
MPEGDDWFYELKSDGSPYYVTVINDWRPDVCAAIVLR